MLPTLLRRARIARGDAADASYAPDEPFALDGDAEESRFRVTDRRRRWTRAHYFPDGGAACRYAEATGGVAWERYVGPTGARNWWSLTEAESEAMALGPARAELVRAGGTAHPATRVSVV